MDSSERRFEDKWVRGPLNRRAEPWAVIVVAALGVVAFSADGRAAEPVEGDPVAGPPREVLQRDDEIVDVVVTGKRVGEDPFEADRAVTAVGPRDLREGQPRTTPEALLDTPGVFVQQTNHGGGAPIVHGLIGPQVLLLFDGVRLNNSVYRTGPVQYLNLVDSLSLARVEVLRGPGSVLYGSDAMGGVIQLFPHQPRDARHMESPEVHGTTQIRYASAGKALGTHAHVELGAQGFGTLVGGTLQSLGDLRGGRGVGVQPHSGYGATTALATLDYRFSDGPLHGWRSKATYLYSRLDGAGRTDALYDKQSLRLYDNELHLFYDRLHFEVDTLDTTIDLTPSLQHFFERADNISLAEDLTTRLGAVRDEVAVNTLGLDAGVETKLIADRLALRYGGMIYRDRIDAQRLERSAGGDWLARADQAFPSDSGYQQYGAFVSLQGAPVATAAGHRVQLRGGYRIHGMAGAAPAREALPEVDYSFLGHVFMGAVQYLYEDHATVALTFAQGFRAPNLHEAVNLGDSGDQFHVPNPDLEPEQSDTFEALGRVKLWRLTMSWMGYASLLDALLIRENTTYQGQSEIGGDPVRRHINAEGGLLWGTEGGLAIDLGAGFTALGQLSYAWGEAEHSDGSSEPLSRIPPLFGSTKLRYDHSLPRRWRGFVETYVRWARTQRRLSARDEQDSRIPDGGTPGWWTWNLRAGLADDGHHRLALGVENLLDRRYKYHGSGLYAPGLNVLLSYEAGF